MKNPTQFRSQTLRPRRNAGSTLAATMMVVLAIVTFLSISALVTSQFGRFAGRQQGNTDLMAAADAAQEYAFTQWKAVAAPIIAKGKVPVTADLTPLNPTLLSKMQNTSLPFDDTGVRFTDVSLYVADQNGSPINSSDLTGTPTSNVPGYPGWTGTTNSYVSVVTVAPATTNYHYGFQASGNGSLTTRRYFQVTQVPLFQAAIFYENKLELHPGAAMTVNGLVHTNADLWARGFSSLQFKSNVSYVTKFNEIGDATVTKGWDGSNGGVIPGVGAYAAVPLVTWSDGKLSGASTTKATQLNQVNPIDPFGNANTSNNGLHDLIEVPTAGTPNASNPQVIYNNASVVITIDSSKSAGSSARAVITDSAGNSLSGPDTSAIMTAINSGASTTVYDQREATNVTVTTLDMTKLATATIAAKAKSATALQSSFNGIVYIHDVSKTTTTPKAIRLINGADLQQDVTVASDNGVYIKGDYNTGTATLTNPVPSNVANPTGIAAPQISGYNRYASAVMADAVTILSNNWNDLNAPSALAARVATPTTVNTAILAGDVASNLNNNHTASGGAHNFPRFLENWNNVNFTYWGSMVEAYRSEQFDGLWQTGNVYYWPNRMWNFDTNFLTNRPPGTASGIQFSRGRWERD